MTPVSMKMMQPHLETVHLHLEMVRLLLVIALFLLVKTSPGGIKKRENSLLDKKEGKKKRDIQ